ncbi:DUF1353 domain-containing protein [Azonexus sp.]|jgi:hypothetical protein|uniref:DUF1353 domain-containing protein n=1 Tax=Azonexus sp. TaxID=1872668 RepID=UPI00282358A1|nr:DUF1353 domain-containing protein [Azonexus sp.]MDR1995121.1 DUF1353 domain-containing protein [Azonexus sp.]
MSAFRSKLNVELIDDDNSLWRLTWPLVYYSDIAGLIVVPVGFETDFASVPRLPVVWLAAGDTARQAATVHDYLYSLNGVALADGQVQPTRVSRQVADAVFEEAMAVSGVSWWRRQAMWMAVRLAGSKFYEERAE